MFQCVDSKYTIFSRVNCFFVFSLPPSLSLPLSPSLSLFLFFFCFFLSVFYLPSTWLIEDNKYIRGKYILCIDIVRGSCCMYPDLSQVYIHTLLFHFSKFYFFLNHGFHKSVTVRHTLDALCPRFR